MKSMTGRWSRFIDRHPLAALGVALAGRIGSLVASVF
jgi:hypothetical protein